MTIDEIVEKEKTGPRCFDSGVYHYRTLKDKDGKQYCSLSDEQCIYYKRIGAKEYCLSYNGEK